MKATIWFRFGPWLPVGYAGSSAQVALTRRSLNSQAVFASGTVKIHGTGKGFQLIPKIAQPCKPFIHLEKSKLCLDDLLAEITAAPESHIPAQHQRFFEPSSWVRHFSTGSLQVLLSNWCDLNVDEPL